MAKTKVLVVDDSALIRNLMKEIIDRSGDLETIGTAADPYVARDMIRSLNPDVLTLDIEMPKMDGLDFLEKIMRLRPMPVVMVSTLTEKGADATFRALELGAVDFVAKPKLGISQGMADCAAEICEKIRAAAASTSYRRTVAIPRTRPTSDAKPIGAEPSQISRAGFSGTEKIIAIGASTGGTEAIREVLSRLNADCPGVVITQHMPPGFTKSFAERLNAICRITVKEAVDGERILPGHAYIAPGGKHLAVAKSGANYLAKVLDDPPVNRHKPSVDVLFNSVATFVGDNAVGVMLTGMGKDGATGMLEMRRRGAYTVAQDEASCVVFGMPREAIAIGATEEVIALPGIAERVMQHVARAGHHVRV